MIGLYVHAERFTVVLQSVPPKMYIFINLARAGFAPLDPKSVKRY